MRLPLALLPLSFAVSLAAAPAVPQKFSFTPAPVAGATSVTPDTAFTPTLGYGFEAGATLTATANGLTSAQPFYFSAAVPSEGNYRVTVTFPTGTDVTVKAELRRLLLERVRVPAGSPAVTRTFVVNTRTPAIAAQVGITAGTVRLKAPRETTQEAWAWDHLLTLEFNGPAPKISALEITPAPGTPTLFLLGDSTVCDQSKEPYNSWGQMLTRWFKPEIAVANHGESGETYRDSIGRRRLDKILSVMRPGDWLIMQFGHNDQKQIASKSGGPFTTYKDEIKKHVDAVRAHGGTPIIVSPMERRAFDAAGKVPPSLIDYATAARQSAKALGVAFIDLNALSKSLYEALGVEGSKAAFVTNSEGKLDNTHHSNFGSYQLAKCIVQALRDQKLPLADHLVADFPAFDPAHPDNPATFAIPASPNFTNQRPLGDEK
jgi:lysophospholipase L1-like esterase